MQLVSAKTANAKLESEVKQEKGNSQDLRKMLADDRNVMSTMDMEHQQQLVELEQRHQEKVLMSVVYMANRMHIHDIFVLYLYVYIYLHTYISSLYRFFTSLTSYRINPYVASQTKYSRKMRRVQRRRSFSSASKFRFVSTGSIAVCLINPCLSISPCFGRNHPKLSLI